MKLSSEIASIARARQEDVQSISALRSMASAFCLLSMARQLLKSSESWWCEPAYGDCLPVDPPVSTYQPCEGRHSKRVPEN
mmetsp:Transcript_35710/g.65907  ORF Transcript_35710/g.65907 Transcript_35710/m.65907 type:complete len:81 (-) Transcript_35710:16-258(-)